MPISNHLCIVPKSAVYYHNVVYPPLILIGLALLLSSVPKSPQMTSNDAFDIICGDLGLPALNYNFTCQATRHQVCTGKYSFFNGYYTCNGVTVCRGASQGEALVSHRYTRTQNFHILNPLEPFKHNSLQNHLVILNLQRISPTKKSVQQNT